MLQFLLAALFAAALWECDPNTFETIKKQINQKHNERFKLYFADSYSCYLNFSDKECPSCQNRDFGFGLEEKLRLAGFWRETSVFETSGHCFGITLLFMQYLLQNPPQIGDSCANILLGFLYNTPNLKEMAHSLQINQPGYYRSAVEKKWVPIDPSSAKECYSLLVGSPAGEYAYIPRNQRNQAKFNRVAFYTALRNLEGQIVLVGLSNEEGMSPHCLAICAIPEKILVFDTNDGLFQFVDFETLSYLHEKLLANERLTFFVSFPIPRIRN